jgi:hypothetical protein
MDQFGLLFSIFLLFPDVYALTLKSKKRAKNTLKSSPPYVQVLRVGVGQITTTSAT